jgi:hypothetical protein
MRHGEGVAAAAMVLVAVLGVPGGVGAQRKPVVAVFGVEARSIKLDADVLASITTYLASKLSESGVYEVVAQDKLKQALAAKKRESYKECYDQSCQIQIGQEVAADKALSTQVMKVGTKCSVASNLYDLKKSTSGKAATTRGECSEDGISASIDVLVAKLCGVASAPPAPSAPTSTPPARAGPTDAELEAMGRRLIGDLAAGARDRVARSAPGLSAELVARLFTGWAEVVAAYGKLVGVSKVRIGRKPPLASAAVACRFAKGNLDMLIVNIDSGGRLGGVWFRPPAADIESVSRTVVADMATGAFHKVTARFTAEMSRSLTAKQLAAVWGQWGSFDSVVRATVDQLAGLTNLTCRFAKSTVEVRITLDFAKRVAGIWMKPLGAERR